MANQQIVVNKPWKVYIQGQKRKKRLAINFIVVILAIILLSLFYSNISLVVIILLILLLFLFRNKLFRRRNKDWKRIRELPNWAYKKMKRKKKNFVEGEHYNYKREGNKFYRKRK
ncbi:MAG: hypothetical protein BWY36_00617 [Candidatus Diapherotrites archaeon ADurb.Bin253]|nr:MAG: hypothetical protein BWY36_00617 [Candidatus Diapherotrites archaeon ADurb.Bin253]